MCAARPQAHPWCMERMVVTARLRPGSEEDAKRLLHSGPPFSPARLGLQRHDVYLGQEMVVFVFEGPDVERRISALVNDPIRSASLAAWAPLLQGQPRVAREAYHWDPKEDTMKTIVIATDGSSSAREAVAFGLELAAEHDTTATFVHVVPAIDVVPTAGYGPAAAHRHEVTHADRQPLDEAGRLAEEAGVPARLELLRGDPVGEIVTYSDSVDADLIVIGSRGHGALTGMLLGSISSAVLHEARRPVLVVRGAESRKLAPAEV